MKKILLYVWQLPQNLLGLLVFCVFRRASYDFEYGDAVVRVNEHFPGGISLGRYIVLRSVQPWNVEHEYGHCRQSRRWGWLYLPVPGLVSITHNMLCRLKKKLNIPYDYYSVWPENQADKLGSVERDIV